MNANGSLPRRLGALAAAVLVALLAFAAAPGRGFAAPPVAAAPSWHAEIGSPSGRFFTDLGRDGLGYAVRNYVDGPRFLDAFERFGGVPVLGFPSSRPWIGAGGFIFQLTQRVQLQWSPLDGRVRIANLFESLSRQQLDEDLLTRHIPRPKADASTTFEQAKLVRLGWLTDPAIAEKFAANPIDPGNIAASLELHGLPMSLPQRFGPFVVQRFQRTAIQRWLEQADGGEPVGAIVLINAGDLYKDLVLASSPAIDPHAIDDTRLVDVRPEPPQFVEAETAGVTAHDYDVEAPELAEALRLLEGLERNAAALELASELQARIRFRRLAARTIGRFSAPGFIAINLDLRREDRRVLAAVLAHELVHLQDFHAQRLGDSYQACLAAEVRAITGEALTWGDLVGQQGKHPAQTLLEHVENLRLEAALAGPDAVRDLVDQVYQQTC